MENASKALIIAGAILLSIILITLGIVVVRNVMPTINKANVNQQEVEAFNAKFDTFVGQNKTQTDVRSVCAAVISSNGAETTNATNHIITINGQKRTSYPTILSNGQNYKIEAEIGNDGYISNIKITPDPYGTTTTP